MEEDFLEGVLEVKRLAYVRRGVSDMLYAHDARVVSSSTKYLAKMTVSVTVFESAGLTVTKKERTMLRTLNNVPLAASLVI